MLTNSGAARTGDGRAWHALSVTLTYALIALLIQLTLGMAIALLLDTDRKGYGILRALMTLPLVVPPAVTGMMFLLMQDGEEVSRLSASTISPPELKTWLDKSLSELKEEVS